MYFKRIAVSCLCLFVAGLVSVRAQRVTFDTNKVSLKNGFAKIEQVSNYKVAYSSTQLDVSRVVTLSKKSDDVFSILAQLLKGSGCEYELNGNYILIKPQKKDKKNVGRKVKVSGRVIDTTGEPAIGATVVEKGNSQNGVATDIDGNYTIEIPTDGELTISYIGFKSQTIHAKGRSVIDVTLAEDRKTLDEIVVVGYGVQRRRDVSTAVSSVKSEALANNPASDFRQALAGRMPGVQVTVPGGDPEGRVSIRVRGVSTVNAGSDPLYVVDGVPMERGFANLNTNDIESVEVLKDASSAAIYGSRGSNGVVLVTTKKGSSEKLSVSYDGYMGVQHVSKKLNMMNAYEYAEFVKDSRDNAYLSEVKNASITDPYGMRPKTYHRIPPDLYPYLEGEAGLTDTDWQDAIFRNAMTTGHNISLSSKGKSVSYFVSGNYMKKNGIIIGSDFEKYSARFNLSATSGKLKLGVNFAPSYSVSNSVDASGANGIVQSALMMPPVFPVYNEDGTYNFQGNGYWRIGTDYQNNEVLNPVAMARLQSDVTDRMSITGKVYAELELLKGLSYKFSLGGDYYGAHNDKYRNSTLPLRGKNYYDSPSNPVGYSSSRFYFNWLVENQFTYSTIINKNHNLTAILVQSAQKETLKLDNVTATDYPNDYIKTINGGTVTKGGSDKTQWTIASYLARVQYNYKGRYMLSAAIRADGSSRFGKNNRWGYFPSASAAWRVNDEQFFREVKELTFIDDLKLRASYGMTGNFQIGNYDHLATMSLDNYIFGGELAYGYKPDNIKRDDLGWETNRMVNVGIDLQMFKGYLGISVDYYNTNTTNMLLYVPVPLLTGYSTSLQNLGKVNNRGWEIALNSQHTFANGLGYSFSANYSKNTNEVKELGPGNAPIISTGSVNHAYYITEVGKPIGNYYLLVQDGVFKTEEELKSYPHFPRTKVGDFRFVDVDKDGKMDLDKDRAIVGNYMPKFTYGFGGKLWYKGFDMDFNFQGVYGNKILNLNKRYIDNMEGNVNGTKIALDRWKSETEPGNGWVNKANRKQTGYNGRTSTWHLESGSYLRLQNLSFGYTLPTAWTRTMKINKLRAYVSAQNLFTITNYSGYSPEVNARPSNNLTPGEDYGTYPLAKTYMFGLNITL